MSLIRTTGISWLREPIGPGRFGSGMNPTIALAIELMRLPGNWLFAKAVRPPPAASPVRGS